MAIKTFQLTLAATPKRLSEVYGAGGEAANIPYRFLAFQAEAADLYIGDSASVSTTVYGAKLAVTGQNEAAARLGPFETGPIKLSDLYAVGAGATLHIVGVPF